MINYKQAGDKNTMRLKEKVKNQMNICGTHITIPGICVSEMMSYYDYDFVWIDLEHTIISIDECYSQIVGAKSVGRESIVRVPQNDLTYTKKVLEMGPDGIIFPMVHSAAEAEELLSYTLYPPYGKRGCGPKRAVRYGVDDEIEYFKSGPFDLCRFLQIECASFIDELEQIADNEYVDGFILGMADLSGSINETGDFTGQKNLALARRAIDICKKHNKTVGVSVTTTDEETLRMYHQMGVNMISAGADFNYIVKGARAAIDVLRKVQSE